MSDTISYTNQAPNLVRNRFLNLVQHAVRNRVTNYDELGDAT